MSVDQMDINDESLFDKAMARYKSGEEASKLINDFEQTKQARMDTPSKTVVIARQDLIYESQL